MTIDLNAQIREAASDPVALREAVAEAHIVPLLMSYVHLTDDRHYLERVRPYIKGGWDYQQEIPEEIQQEIRADLVATIERLAQSGDVQHKDPSEAELKEMINVACGAEVPDIYLPIFYEETCFGGRDYRQIEWRQEVGEDRLDQYKVVIAGAGFSGIVMGVRLKQAGIPFVIIEKNDEVGGTWYENTYPGIGVDTPCHFYSFSLMPNTDWPDFFSKGAEIQAYLERIVEEFGLREHIRFNEEVVEADYDESGHLWRVRTARQGGGETLDAKVFISAVGILIARLFPISRGWTASRDQNSIPRAGITVSTSRARRWP